jgi:hypothetical protein
VTAKTVDGQSINGRIVASFSIERQTADVRKIGENVITASAVAADAGVEIAAAVWDRVLSGATHNIATSAGRRLRGLQDFGSYEGGAIWIDTVNGTAGTVSYENGTVENPVDTLADALTIAAAVGLKHLHIANGSTITLTSTLDTYEIEGDEYGIILNGQSINGTSIHSAHKVGTGISGTFSGNPHILHSMVDDLGITGPNARIGWCPIMGPVTSNGTGTWVLHGCWGQAGAVFDFGAGAGQTAYILDWVGGPIEIKNMAAGDTLYVEGRSGSLTLAASCTAGTVVIAGEVALNNSGSGQTISQKSRFELTRILSDSTAFAGADIAAILADTGTDGVALATDSIGADEISAAGAAKIADIVLRRTQSNVQSSSDGDAISLGCLYGLIQQAQESNTTATPGSLTVYRIDGTTVLGTKTVSTDPTADPIDGIS